MVAFNPACLSSYLTFRYVVEEGIGWMPGVLPKLPRCKHQQQIGVCNADQVYQTLRQLVEQNKTEEGKIGILLSGGIDSAILASLLPRKTPAFTIRFEANHAIDESGFASRYAEYCGLEHHTISVSWNDQIFLMETLMRNKRSPLHPVEVGLYKVALQAKKSGIEKLLVGNGADSTFGGMNKLLAQDWEFKDFIKRYSFIDPYLVLKTPISMQHIYGRFRDKDGIDVEQFLKVIHGKGITQAFNNAIGLAGCQIVEPYENLRLKGKLDLRRIRNGETKYILREVFNRQYPGFECPDKIPFTRPMDQWLAEWQGPRRPEFKNRLDMAMFSGEQKWLLYCLEKFLNMLENGNV